MQAEMDAHIAEAAAVQGPRNVHGDACSSHAVSSDPSVFCRRRPVMRRGGQWIDALRRLFSTLSATSCADAAHHDHDRAHAGVRYRVQQQRVFSVLNGILCALRYPMTRRW